MKGLWGVYFNKTKWWIDPFLLFLAIFPLYYFFPSQQLDRDVLTELSLINKGWHQSPDPAHMLYVNMGIWCVKLFTFAGYDGEAIKVMQMLNALFGAGGVAVFCLILRQLRIQSSIAAIISLTAGLSYAYWTHTADAFFIIPAAFFCIGRLRIVNLPVKFRPGE